MALAWGLSVFFVKQRAKTLPLLEQGVFPAAVHNKAIQKCRESYRVSCRGQSIFEHTEKEIEEGTDFARLSLLPIGYSKILF